MKFSRRDFLAIAPALAFGNIGAQAQTSAEPEVPWSSGSEPPTSSIPLGLTDCHHHIFDSRFPLAPGVSSVHPDSTLYGYLKLARRLGISRHVVVQPSNYGLDNSCLLDALRSGGPSVRGVAVVSTDVSDAELQRLHDAGVRGIRFNFAPIGVTKPEMIAPLARRIASMGWSVQLNALPEQTLAIADILRDLPCPVVLEHLGRVPEPTGINHPVYAFAQRLLGEGKAWVKISGLYNDSKIGAPDYADTGAVVRAFVATAPERLVWGTGWPHTAEPLNKKPNDAHLFDLIASWIPDTGLRKQIMVDNATKLFGF